MSTTQNGVQAPTQQQTNKPPTRLEAMKNMLESPNIQEQLRNALQDNAPAFVASIIDLYNGDTYLQGCQPAAVAMECLKAATLKLPINKNLGFAYIVPYKQRMQDQSGQWVEKLNPQFQIGYKGLIQLAMRTGQYKIINADAVYEGEFVSVNKLKGEFDLSGRKKSETIIGYFAHIEMLNGFSKTLYMTKDKVTAHAKKYSKSFNQANGPWTKEFDAMAIKTVLRNLLSHYGFLSVEMVGAIDNDTQDETAEVVRTEIRENANRQQINIPEATVVDENAAQFTDSDEAPY